MDCRRIKELMITDLIDDEASPAEKKEIESHLLSCSSCRTFKKTLEEKVKKPFYGLNELTPPKEVWQNIKEAIEEEQQPQTQPLLERLLDLLQNSLLVRRPAFVFSSILAVILAAIVFFQSPFRRNLLVKDYLNEQSQFLVSLSATPNGELEKDFDLGSSIERYLF